MSKQRIILISAFAIPFFVYALTLSKVWALDTLFAIDSAEMVIAAHTLGIDHPPGHPLYLIFAHLFSRLPFALPDTGVILTSAVFSALACGFLTLAINQVTQNVFVALCTGGTFAFARIFWIHATLAEVYAVQLFFLSLFLLLSARLQQDPRPQNLYLLSFVIGLSASANILLTILLMPAVAFVVIRSGVLYSDNHWQVATHLRAKLIALLGMSPLLYIPARLSSDTAFISDFVFLNGFEVQSLRWYIWYLSAEEFTGTKLFDIPLTLYPGLFKNYIQIFTSNATVIPVIGTLFCFSRLRSKPSLSPPPEQHRRRQRPTKPPWQSRFLSASKDPHRTYVAAVGIAFLTTLIPVLSYQVPDREVFFMPSFFFFIALSGLGLSVIANKVPKRFRPVLCLIPLYLMIAHYATIVNLTQNETRYNQRTERFKALPPESIILGPDDGHATRYKYFQMVRNMRPDIDIHTMGMLAPRMRQNQSTRGSDFALNFNVSDRLQVIQHLLSTYPNRPLFAILDDRMPPEYNHFRTERSGIDPYLLKVTAKPPAIVTKNPRPVAVQLEDEYFNTFRFVGFSIQGLDHGQSQTYARPIQIGNQMIHGQIQRSEMFELTYQIQSKTDLTNQVFAEFAWINERLEIPSAQGFTAAKTIELIPDAMQPGLYREDRFTFKIPGYIPPGLYTLAVRTNTTSNEIQGQYQGKPVRTLKPISMTRPWQGQTDYRPLGIIRLQ